MHINFRKKLIITVMIIILIIVSTVIYILYPFPNKFDFLFLDNETYAIYRYNSISPFVQIPSEYKGKPVTVIAGPIAVLNSDKVLSITVPDSVTDIDISSFASLENLQEITLPANLSEINESMFFRCFKLKEILIPQTVTKIYRNAFAHCTSLTQINIPGSVSSIGEAKMQYTDARQQLTGDRHRADNPEDNSSFADCSSLKEFTVDKNNKYFTAVDGVLYSKDMTKLIAYPAAKEGTEYTVTETVTEIYCDAFSGSKNLKKIVINERACKIGPRAFENCKNLVEINIPDRIDMIKDGTFSGCVSLEHIRIPFAVKTIGKEAFNYCSSLRNIDIPENVAEIGERAFDGCESITEAEISENVSSIGDSAFAGCDSLRAINVSENNIFYKSIDGVLYSSKMKSLLQYPGGKSDIKVYHVPYTVTDIPSGALSNNKLRSIIYPENMPDQLISPSYCTDMEYLTVPKSCMNSILYFNKDDKTKTAYIYTIDDEWHSERTLNNDRLIRLVLNRGSFPENWPYDKDLIKEGYDFLGWSNKSCHDDNYGDLPETSDKADIWYAVFSEK